MSSYPEIPRPTESSEMNAQLTEVFLMSQDDRLSLMGSRGAAILRLATSAADRIETTEGPAARQAFLLGIAVGSVAQLMIEKSEFDPPQSIERELEALDIAG